MTPEEIAELRRLAEAGTPGPWAAEPWGDTDRDVVTKASDHHVIAELAGYPRKARDAALIVAMRNKLAGMLDEIERLRQALSSIEVYGSDTLSGPVGNQPDDRKWQREAVIEMTLRARNGGRRPEMTDIVARVLREENERLKTTLRAIGVCMSCVGGRIMEPCTDCLGTGWNNGENPLTQLDEVVHLLSIEDSVTTPGEAIRVLVAEIERLRGEREWLPIESAPKITGVEIIGAGFISGKMIKEPFISFWSPTLEKFFANPTHWMPLPSAPDKAPRT